MAIIVVLILLAMFCLNKMLIYKGTGRLSKDLQVLLKSNNPIGKASQKKILILYARESDQFERVINSFNNMLKEDEAVEVQNKIKYLNLVNSFLTYFGCRFMIYTS